MLDALDRSLHPTGNEDQWGQDQVLSIREPPGDHPAITLKGQALEKVDSFSCIPGK